MNFSLQCCEWPLGGNWSQGGAKLLYPGLDDTFMITLLIQTFSIKFKFKALQHLSGQKPLNFLTFPGMLHVPVVLIM